MLRGRVYMAQLEEQEGEHSRDCMLGAAVILQLECRELCAPRID